MALKKKLLVLGGSHGDIPQIEAAKRLGLYVITSGNKPDQAGHSYGNESHFVDYSDHKSVTELARDIKPVAICASCNDFSALSAAYASEKLSLPGYDPYETMLTLHHKDRFRHYAQKAGIPVPAAAAFSNPGELSEMTARLQYPLIVKPVDLTGGKGMAIVHSPGSLQIKTSEALKNSRAGRAVIEEYLTGSNHAFSAILIQQKVAFYFMDIEHYYLNPFMVSGASGPVVHNHSITSRLIHESERMACDLALVDGILHMQFILKKNQPYILEVCRRPPGDLYPWLVKRASGQDIALNYIQSLLDGKIAIAQESKTKYITRHCVMASKKGRFQGIKIKQNIKKKVIDQFSLAAIGDRIEDSLTFKASIFFLQWTSRAEMEKNMNHLPEWIEIQVEDE